MTGVQTCALPIYFTPLAAGVLPGSTSTPVTVDASGAARIAVTAAGLGEPLYVVDEQALQAGSVYSVFVLGATDAVVGVPYRDR